MSTIIITGQPGSGKTMLTRIITEMGVPMVLSAGEDPDALEDADMKHALTYFPFNFPIELVRSRDAVHPIWGFKFALLNNSAAPITVGQFRSPKIIFLHRDMVAVAAHNQFSLDRAIEEEGRLAYFARQMECPVLHLSSETLFRNPVGTALMVEGFIDLASYREPVAA